MRIALVRMGILAGFVMLSGTGRADEPISLRVKWDAPGHAIGPQYYGHNSVWSRGGLGLWDETARAYRPAVVDLVKKLRPGVLRFPGGTRAMRYRFEETIGDYRSRKPQCDTFTSKFDATSYGLDEFLRFAEQLGTEVSLVAPWVIESPERTAAMVAYANASVDSTVILGTDFYGQNWFNAGYWAKLRAQNGHPKPYAVKYVEIGNEEYFALPVGLKKSCDWPIIYKQNFRYVNQERIWSTAADYEAQVRATSKLVRQVDPNILIGVAGQSKYPAADEPSDVGTFQSIVDNKLGNFDPWNVRLGNGAPDNFDFFILHPYNSGLGKGSLDFGDQFQNALREFRRLWPGRQIATTEYGFWFRGNSMLNAIASADIIRATIAEGALMALRHNLVEDNSSAYFGASGAIQMNGDLPSTSVPYWMMELLANNFYGNALPTISNSENVAAQVAVGGDRKTFNVLLINRGPNDHRFENVNVPLPAGNWQGNLKGIRADKLADTTAAVVNEKYVGSRVLRVEVPPHSVNVLTLELTN